MKKVYCRLPVPVKCKRECCMVLLPHTRHAYQKYCTPHCCNLARHERRKQRERETK